MRTLIKILPILVLFTACSEGGGDGEPPFIPLDNNTIFLTEEIIVSSPSNGDTLFTTTPGFVWEATPNDLVFVGIFTDNISVNPGSGINNKEDNIWAWHSGLGTGRVGNISFDDGFNVMNGELDVFSSPTPLEPGRTYIWGIWAWDSSGLNITRSSLEMAFTVDSTAVAN